MKPGYLYWEITWQWAHRILASIFELRYAPPLAQACLLLAMESFMLKKFASVQPHEDQLDLKLVLLLELILILEITVGIFCLLTQLGDAAATGAIAGLLAVAWAKTFPDQKTSRNIMGYSIFCTSRRNCFEEW